MCVTIYYSSRENPLKIFSLFEKCLKFLFFIQLEQFLLTSEGKEWSFDIYYHSPHQPHVLKETGDRSCSGMMADDVIMLNLFPELPVDAFSPHNEIIFVVDCSGNYYLLKFKSVYMVSESSSPFK